MNKQTIYKQIHREYELERDKNSRLEEQRLNSLYERLPKLKETDKELKFLSISLTKQIISHSPSIENIKHEISLLKAKRTAILKSAGLSEEYLAPIYTCSLCKDTGYIDSEKCTCLKNKLIKKYYALSNLDTVLEYENFEKFDLSHYSNEPYPNEELTPFANMSNILEEVLDLIDTKKNRYFNFYFYGNSGLGKTFMSSCIAKSLLDRGMSVIYMTAYSLATLLEKNRFRHDELEEDDEAVDMLFEADLLIIDDLGTESPNSVTVTEFFNILNSRLINKKSTVISSNLKPSELSIQYSDRVVSRIVGSYNIHHFYGNDIRMK